MKRNLRMNGRSHKTKLWMVMFAVAVVAAAALWQPLTSSNAASKRKLEDIYRRPAPNYDLNASRALPNVRQATSAQLAALEALKTAVNAPGMTSRWNDFGGTPEVMYDFASKSYPGSPEEAARAFINENAALFGVSELNNFRVFSQRQALGGNLMRFQQVFNGVPVSDGGIGIVMNAQNQVVMASGPFFRDVAINTQPAISADQAVAAANGDLNRFHVALPSAATNLLQNGLSIISQQLGAVDSIPPTLSIYPTADGYRLAWKIAKFSTNPFGLYMITVDANSGEVIARKDFAAFQSLPGAETADIYPKYPQIDANLKDNSVISTCQTATGPAPCGQERVTLRKFDPSNRVTGVNGTLTGTHALVNNALISKQPFGQAALGTWHFRKDDPTALEARTNEADQLAEPAEHQDDINAFFFVTYLVEYVDHLHVGGDNTALGGGAFPDDYPNKSTPLPATVHIPNVLLALDAAEGTLPDPTDPNFAQIVLGLDNALAFNLTSIIEGVTATKSPVVVNPTVYGHGYYFNDLALEGTVPYHEGMHAITSPIAGLEGIEGSALNEAQADMWAFTITDNASLGDYVVNSKGYRQLARDRGRDPDSLAYIRSAKSTLKYSDYATWSTGLEEEHYDGEIMMSTLWDLREMFNRVYPQDATYRRPQPKDGKAEKKIKNGTNIFERDFLGAMYVLGTTSPDTFVKTRDAFIVADQLLYPSNSADPDSPGRHRAMIEQIFAAKELGINAREFSGGKVTISTRVSHFAADQAAPAVPSNVQVAPATARSLRVSWDAVPGATSYQVLKRKTANAGMREQNGEREFIDGDDSTTGYRHVAFVNGSELSYEDRGKVQEVFAPAGLNNLFDSEYVVRAVGVNSTGQLGWSGLSNSSRATQVRQDVTAQVDSALSNISFTGGITSFDNKLTNTRGAFSSDKTLYGPIEFQVVSISNPSVSVKNADAANNIFVFNQTLPLGFTSSAKRMEFNNPLTQLFTFDARIYANAFAGTAFGGSETGDGGDDEPAALVYSLYHETKTGTIVGGEPTGTADENGSVTWGDPAFEGITWMDVPITTQSDATALEATLSCATCADLDFELRTEDDTVITRSAGATATEFVSSAVQPNRTYKLRVLGFLNGPSQFNIATTQLLPENSPNANGGTRTVGGSGSGTLSATTKLVSGLFRFTVNPLTKKVTFIRMQ